MKKSFIFAVIPLLTLSFACKRKGEVIHQKFKQTQFLLGTYVTITIYAEKEPSLVFEKVFREIKRISDKYSVEKENSYVNQLCIKASRGKAEVDEETAFLIRKSLQISRLTQGTFDITVAVLKKLWGFNLSPRLPEKNKIQKAIKKVGWQKIKLSGRILQLPEGTFLDLSGIAKGYAIDRAVEILKKEGIKSALVDAGGDIYALGKKPDGSRWKIGIKHPRQKGLLKIVELENAAIATSGDYENFFIYKGKRYHHIFNPATGYPASSCQSVSVITDSALEADALATGLFVAGPERAKALSKNLRITSFVVDREGNLFIFDFYNSDLKYY